MTPILAPLLCAQPSGRLLDRQFRQRVFVVLKKHKDKKLN
jgi:hypothetical protein